MGADTVLRPLPVAWVIPHQRVSKVALFLARVRAQKEQASQTLGLPAMPTICFSPHFVFLMGF